MDETLYALEHPEPEPRFDVVIYEISSGIVDTIAGENMRLLTGFYNATKRLETVLLRGNLNDRHAAKIVPAGSATKGDVLP